ALQDMMAWAEKGVAPPPSTVFTIKNGQVIPADTAAERHGLQPVMTLTVNGTERATVGVNQPVNVVSKVEMPPGTGKVIPQYTWTVTRDGGEKPQTLASASPLTFPEPGTYVIKLEVNGQRDGLSAPDNQTLLHNFKEVRVVVQ